MCSIIKSVLVVSAASTTASTTIIAVGRYLPTQFSKGGKHGNAKHIFWCSRQFVVRVHLGFIAQS